MTAVAVSLVSATTVLAFTSGSAEAAFPGENGRIVFSSNQNTEKFPNPEGDFEIYTVNPDGSGTKRLTDDGFFDFVPAWSPDGKKIAFISERNSGKGVDNPERDLEIFTIKKNGAGLEQVTVNEEFDFDPVFSADGREIAYEKFLNGGSSTDIYTVGATGGSEKMVAGDPFAFEFSPAWSPDGAWLAYVSSAGSDSDILARALDGSGQTLPLTDNDVDDGDPNWSPDSSTLTFNSRLETPSNEDGNREIFTLAFDGSRASTPKQITRTDGQGLSSENPAYSPDGENIVFQSNRSNGGEFFSEDLYVADSSPDAPITGTRIGPETPRSAEVTADWQPLKGRSSEARRLEP